MDENCLHCGRPTAAGTTLFSARKRARDAVSGKEGFLCQACQPGSARPGAEQTMPQSGRYIVV